MATSQPTIKLGASGTAVTEWQKILGVAQDGKFGPATKTATMAWQKAHGLTADGSVGPATWAAAAQQVTTDVGVATDLGLGNTSAPIPAPIPAANSEEPAFLATIPGWVKWSVGGLLMAVFGYSIFTGNVKLTNEARR